MIGVDSSGGEWHSVFVLILLNDYFNIAPPGSYYQYPLSRINGESVVPYTVKEGTKYVPLFYFEGETEHLKLKSEVVDG